MDVISILRQVDLFRGLNDAQLEDIGLLADQETYQDGDTICAQGEVADKLYIICQGQVEVAVDRMDGDREPVVYLGKGQIVGEMTLVDEGLRSASIIAAENPTRLFGIPNAAFNSLCEQHTDIGYLIMRNIAQDLSFKLRHQDQGTSARENG